jgi:uncharacterized protein YjbJ (UPF0337 family)
VAQADSNPETERPDGGEFGLIAVECYLADGAEFPKGSGATADGVAFAFEPDSPPRTPAPSRFPRTPARVGSKRVPHRGEGVAVSGLIDRITGRAKKAAGDLADDPKLRAQGVREERKADAKDELARAQQEADRKADEVARLERESARKRPLDAA